MSKTSLIWLVMACSIVHPFIATLQVLYIWLNSRTIKWTLFTGMILRILHYSILIQQFQSEIGYRKRLCCLSCVRHLYMLYTTRPNLADLAH